MNTFNAENLKNSLNSFGAAQAAVSSSYGFIAGLALHLQGICQLEALAVLNDHYEGAPKEASLTFRKSLSAATKRLQDEIGGLVWIAKFSEKEGFSLQTKAYASDKAKSINLIVGKALSKTKTQKFNVAGGFRQLTDEALESLLWHVKLESNLRWEGKEMAKEQAEKAAAATVSKQAVAKKAVAKKAVAKKAVAKKAVAKKA